MPRRLFVLTLILFVSAACGADSAPPGEDLEAWLRSQCREVEFWAERLPPIPVVTPTLGGLESGSIVAYAEELAEGAEGLILRLETLGPSGDAAADPLYDGLVVALETVAADAGAVADQYRGSAVIPVVEVIPLVNRAAEFTLAVGTAFGAFSRDPDVGPLVSEIESCQAVGRALSS